MEFRDPLLPLWSMELLANAFLWLWLFCVGATVGSFLNVVVYRLPRRKNLAYPGSACPRCGHPIRLLDNIPILSWLSLRGRCRDCGGRISPRYFVVELIVAITFLIVLAAEHFLPAGLFVTHRRHLLTPHDGIPFWCMYVTHIGLVTTFLAAILILGDRFRLPAALFVPILIVGFVVPLIYPQIRSVSALAYPDENVWWAGLIDGLAGLATGGMIALIGSFWRLRSDGEWPSFAPVSWSCAHGVVLGWQRTIFWLPVILLVCLLTAGVLRVFPVDSGSPDTAPPSNADLPDASAPPEALDTGPEIPPDELAPAPPSTNSELP